MAAQIPNYDQCSLVLPMRGSNGSTSFPEYSKYAHTVTPFGNAQISTAQSAFYGSSGLFDGTDDYLSIPNHVAFQFGGENFTIRARIRLSAYAIDPYVASILTKVSAGYDFFFIITGTPTSYTMLKFIGYSAPGVSETIIGNFTFSLNTWYDVEVCRIGNLVYLFVNGTLLNAGGTSFTTTIQTTSSPLIAMSSRIDAGTNRYDFPGNCNDIVVWKGYGAHSANFTPPGAMTGLVSGNVKDGTGANAVGRKVFATSSLAPTTIKQVTTDANGNFLFDILPSTEHDIVRIQDSGEDYNDLVFADVIPGGS